MPKTMQLAVLKYEGSNSIYYLYTILNSFQIRSMIVKHFGKQNIHIVKI